MYSNDFNQIKSGLINYTGALLKACPFDGEKASRQYVAAALIEQALDLIRNSDDSIEMYVAKPIFRATIILIDDRIRALSELQQIDAVKQQIESYKNCKDFLKKLTDNIQE